MNMKTRIIYTDISEAVLGRKCRKTNTSKKIFTKTK